MNEPLTKVELIEVMEMYVRPAYELLASFLAGATIALGTAVVLWGVIRLAKRLGL